ncbi:hypothetical protein SAMN02745866_00369 [Alteromonadaceae bacterium Bs31]|nr:hypothetical protein SAMN02745866_00369 [Alteromonadaceae bacterium Bs31]
MLRVFPLVVLMMCNFSLAGELQQALHIDKALPDNTTLEFPNDNKVLPDHSGFEVLNYVLMSSEGGERWAVLTIRNPLSGKRIFENNYVMALLANGERITPEPVSVVLDSGETVSVTLNFGIQKFPILQLYGRN